MNQVALGEHQRQRSHASPAGAGSSEDSRRPTSRRSTSRSPSAPPASPSRPRAACCPSIAKLPNGQYDYTALDRKLQRDQVDRRTTPTETKANFNADPNIPYDIVVATLDAMRHDGRRQDPVPRRRLRGGDPLMPTARDPAGHLAPRGQEGHPVLRPQARPSPRHQGPEHHPDDGHDDHHPGVLAQVVLVERVDASTFDQNLQLPKSTTSSSRSWRSPSPSPRRSSWSRATPSPRSTPARSTRRSSATATTATTSRRSSTSLEKHAKREKKVAELTGSKFDGPAHDRRRPDDALPPAHRDPLLVRPGRVTRTTACSSSRPKASEPGAARGLTSSRSKLLYRRPRGRLSCYPARALRCVCGQRRTSRRRRPSTCHDSPSLRHRRARTFVCRHLADARALLLAAASACAGVVVDALAARARRRRHEGGGEASLVLPDLGQRAVPRRHAGQHAAHGRPRRLRARPRLRPGDLPPAQEPARPQVDARDLRADLRDLQDVPRSRRASSSCMLEVFIGVDHRRLLRRARSTSSRREGRRSSCSSASSASPAATASPGSASASTRSPTRARRSPASRASRSRSTRSRSRPA